MIVSIHQPAYNPWLGYLDKLSNSDIFIYLDTVQFEKNSFINRNKIKTPQGELWLTIPVKTKDHLNKPISEIEIDYKKNWIKNHLRSIEMNYKRAENFDLVYSFWKSILEIEYKYLSDLCYNQLIGVTDLLGVKNTKIIKSSDFSFESRKSDLILDICIEFKAKKYISGKMGKDYLDLAIFNNNNIEVTFQEYSQLEYKQLWGEFIPNLGVLDYLMNTTKI